MNDPVSVAAPRPERPPLAFPGVVVVDTREQRPYDFAGIRSDARTGYRPLAVTTARGTLAAGDYSLLGYEARVTLERKSLEDFYSTLGQCRNRFVRELQRIQDGEYTVARVVVEAEWSAVLRCPPERSRLNPKTVWRSVVAWEERFPKVHWHMAPGRVAAERYVFRVLERYFRGHAPEARQHRW